MTTLVQKCQAIIESNILNGVYKPGEKLGMHRLRDELGIGLSPIREALSKLLSTGLIVAEDNKGFSVVRITQKEIRDLSHTYALIESLALQQAIKHGDDEWEANITAKFYRLSKLEQSKEKIAWEEWLPLNSAFHRALVEGCNSASLLEIRDLLAHKLQLYVSRLFDLPQWVEVNNQEHKDLADAVLARDADKACRILSHHFLGSLDEQLEKLDLPVE